MKKIVAALLCFSIIFFTTSCGNTSKTCAFDGCEEPASEGRDACQKHACLISSCPNSICENEAKYCSEHSCKMEGCLEQRASTSEYCAKHICHKASCNMPVIKGEQLCSNHISEKCNYAGCHSLGTVGGYCRSHLCSEIDCQNGCVEGSGFCGDHQSNACKHSGCIYPTQKYESPLDTANANYCFEHGCRYINCNEESIVGSICCAKHTIAVEEAEAAKYKDTLSVNTAGKQIWKVYANSTEFHFVATCSGSGYFGIKVLDSNQDFFALVMNEVGSYELDKTVSGFTVGELYYIQIEYTNGSISYGWAGSYGQ